MKKKSGLRGRSMMVGAFVIVLFAGACVLGVTAQRGLPGATTTTVRAAFNDVGALRVGDDVRIGGVRVGQVGAITLQDGRAVARLDLSDVSKVYQNATATTATVGARSALGLKYVALTPGTPVAGEIPPGQVISPSETTGAQDVTDLLTVLDKPTRDALGSTVREVGGGLAGRGGDLEDALKSLSSEERDIGTVSRALSANQGADTTEMLEAVDTFAGRFSGRQQEISGLERNLDATINAVGTGQGKPLGDALDRAPSTMKQARGALNSLDRPLTDVERAMTDLRPGGAALGRATPDVRSVLRDSVPPLEKVPRVARQAEPAVTDLTAVMADAKPLAPRLTRGLNLAADPLATMAAYSGDISNFFTYLTRALSDGDDAGHWARMMVIPDTETVSGNVPNTEDPLMHRDPYAPPGQAVNENAPPLDQVGR